MQLADILFSQGFGTRRACAALVADGQVQIDGRTVVDAAERFDTSGLHLVVAGQTWRYHERLLLMLHKPSGYECSRQPSHHPSVLSLVPEPYRVRGVQPVGRLDADTTGLLLLTDDGALLHRLTHPKHHVDKRYLLETADAIGDAEVAALLAGVGLRGENTPAQARACERLGPQTLMLTIDEGRYHQVKRMLAATGHRVVKLHRERFGAWALPDDLLPGQWRHLHWPPAP
jgi:16S rRNA pseudouridine516 synthase